MQSVTGGGWARFTMQAVICLLMLVWMTSLAGPVQAQELQSVAAVDDAAEQADDAAAIAQGQLVQAPAEPLVIAEQTGLADADHEDAPAGDRETKSADAASAGPGAAVRRLAQTTVGWAQQATAGVAMLRDALLGDAGSGAAPSFSVDGGAFWDALLSLALVAVVTFVVLFIVRRLVDGLLPALSRWMLAPTDAIALGLRRAIAVLLAVAGDAVTVLVAAAGGYLAGALLAAPAGIGMRAMLFINAFMLVELIKVVVRCVFSPRHGRLRLIALSDTVAGWWSIRLRWLVGVLGYGLLLAVPIVQAQTAPVLARLLAVVLMLAAYVYALRVLVANRALLTQRLQV